MASLPGIHHVTAISNDAQRNVDHYVGVLGLRLVKKTVNFDDPGSYHLYYGDELGRPGSAMTFFVWPGAPRGRAGTGQVGSTAFAVPSGSLNWWADRLQRAGVRVQGPTERLDDQVLAFEDPDGIGLELVAPAEPDPRVPWLDGLVPPEHAIRGFHSVTLSLAGQEESARLLTDTLGFQPVAADGPRARFATGEAGGVVDLLAQPDLPVGDTAPGTVHHVAWRTPDDPSQLEWRQTVARAGYDVTPVLDRQYFHSIYFREPGGVLFEIATDVPGFTFDEPADHLGEALRLPPRLEPLRPELEQRLPPFTVPAR
ncbi:MAG TPA: ring-cleaving dioxygenase [Candidatus Dormibacteraeota bacterium]|nr:ring-cleaving dioxygenase [Candidatus Dormibacteraeota bacterium]